MVLRPEVVMRLLRERGRWRWCFLPSWSSSKDVEECGGHFQSEDQVEESRPWIAACGSCSRPWVRDFPSPMEMRSIISMALPRM
jgi:hypothetical protein